MKGWKIEKNVENYNRKEYLRQEEKKYRKKENVKNCSA